MKEALSKDGEGLFVTLGPSVFSADRSHSGGSTKGERLSAKMRSLPVSSEPYESSAPKELGENNPQRQTHLCSFASP